MTDKEYKWWEDLDVGRTIENLLLGVILFLGRFVRTFCLYLFNPSPMINRTIFDSSLKLLGKQYDTRPMTYLTLGGFLYLFLVPDLFFFASPFLEALAPLTTQIDIKVDTFKLTTMAAFMLPFIVFVALYAYVTMVVFKTISVDANFKVLLNINCYFVGTIAIIVGLVWLASGDAWDFALGDTNNPWSAIPLYALMGFQILVLMFVFWRYVCQLITYSKQPWWKVGACIVFSFVFFWVLAIPLLWILRGALHS